MIQLLVIDNRDTDALISDREVKEEPIDIPNATEYSHRLHIQMLKHTMIARDHNNNIIRSIGGGVHYSQSCLDPDVNQQILTRTIKILCKASENPAILNKQEIEILKYDTLTRVAVFESIESNKKFYLEKQNDYPDVFTSPPPNHKEILLELLELNESEISK